MSPVSIISERDGLLTVKEAVSISSYTPSHVARLAKGGKVQAVQREGKWLIDARSLERYLESNRQRQRSGRKEDRSILRRPMDQVNYSAVWTLNQANFGAFNPKSLLESLAIAGCSVLVGVLLHGLTISGLSVVSLYDGGKDVAAELRDRYVASVAEISQMASVISSWPKK